MVNQFVKETPIVTHRGPCRGSSFYMRVGETGWKCKACGLPQTAHPLQLALRDDFTAEELRILADRMDEEQKT
jgi:hypothetical protein